MQQIPNGSKHLIDLLKLRIYLSRQFNQNTKSSYIMRVFILSTGRCGSTAIYQACKHIENFTAAHESLAKKFGSGRFEYPENHIESDNRLSWHLGQLDAFYGNEAFYVHLKRNEQAVAASFMKRFNGAVSIIDAFCAGIRMRPHTKLDESEKRTACHDYIDTVNYNIEFFMSNKTNKMTIELENIQTDFPLFWKKIGAKGNLSNALEEFNLKHNASQ